MRNNFELYLMIFVWNLITFWQLSKDINFLFIFMVGNTFIMLILANLYEKYNYKVEDVINKIQNGKNKKNN
jgi:hypothetical protein